MVGTGFGQWVRTGRAPDLRYLDAKVTRPCEAHVLEAHSAKRGHGIHIT